MKLVPAPALKRGKVVFTHNCELAMESDNLAILLLSVFESLIMYLQKLSLWEKSVWQSFILAVNGVQVILER
jgi:hypothetical protein